MSTSAPNFGKKVSHLRKAKGLSLRRLGAETGVSNSYLSQIERGKVAPPSPRVIRQLSKALGCPYLGLMQLAGHLSTVSGGSIPSEPILRIAGQTQSLSDLTTAEQRKLLALVKAMRQNRS